MKLSLLAAAATAQLATYNAGNDISYAVSIPDATAQAGSGDFHFQLAGPTSFQWIALGFGEGMQGSSIYVMYADGAGNVTVSPRIGVGFREPQVNPAATVTLLEGSGISNGQMVANVRCSGCASWDGGSIDFTASSQPMIHAHRTGAALDSTDPQQDISQHQNDGQEFSIELATATGGAVDVNPFLDGGDGGNGDGNGDSPVTPPAGGDGENTGSSPGNESNDNTLIKAHGVIMGLTVVVLLPLGGIAIRLLPVPWWLHGAIQTIFLLLFTAGFGIGYYEAGELGIRYQTPGKTHTIFGTVIFAFFWLQPFLGIAHHLAYKKQQSRTALSHAHIWWGRIVFILAIVNGGLGLQLANNTSGGEIAYGVVAGIIGVVYILAVLFGEWRRSKKLKQRSEKEASPEGSTM